MNTTSGGPNIYTQDPHFWRAGAIPTVVFMCVLLAALTIDTLKQITPGSARVPAYEVINSAVIYQYDAHRGAASYLAIPPITWRYLTRLHRGENDASRPVERAHRARTRLYRRA